jgi:hypothetical protein
MPEYGWGSAVVLLEYGCIHYLLDCDLWLRVREFWEEAVERLCCRLLTVYFGTPNMFITLWFGFDYGTNPPLGTLII